MKETLPRGRLKVYEQIRIQLTSMMPSLKYLPRFVKRLPIFSVLMVYVFICSGIIITVACLVGQVLWIINKTLYRKLMTKLAFFLFGRKYELNFNIYRSSVLCRNDLGMHRLGRYSSDFIWN